jgi:hypothetical protein
MYSFAQCSSFSDRPLGIHMPSVSSFAPSFGTVQDTGMPFCLAARAFEMIVQATSISPFWNQLVKSGSSPSRGSFAFSFSKNAQQGAMLSGMSSSVPPPAICAAGWKPMPSS